jgi:hypothetical protein
MAHGEVKKEVAQPQAKWNAACDAILVETLCREREMGFQTSNGNWHTCAWTEVKKKLAGTELHSGGAAKNVKSCQDQWTVVCPCMLTGDRTRTNSHLFTSFS